MKVNDRNYQGKAVVTIDVLDHGFVALRNLSGPTRRDSHSFIFDACDIDPANSARMSFDSMDSGRTEEADLKLCTYLMKNKHTTPFEMIECWIEMKMPIFVARQFVRHRTATINEVSGRYVTLPAQWYIPTTVGGKPENAKQGQGPLDEIIQSEYKDSLWSSCSIGYSKYLKFIKKGVAAEHARLFLHVNHYTHWLWKQDLNNLMHFLSLRNHHHAQIEAQLYAQAIEAMLMKFLPHSMKLYNEFRRQK